MVAVPVSDRVCSAEERQRVEDNLPLVRFVFGRYFRGSLWAEDALVAAGELALIIAAKRFAPERGFAFSTYAVRVIANAMKRALHLEIRSLSTVASVPLELLLDRADERERAAVDVLQVDAMMEALCRLSDREYVIVSERHLAGRTLQEVADSMGVTRSYVQQVETKALMRMFELMRE